MNKFKCYIKSSQIVFSIYIEAIRTTIIVCTRTSKEIKLQIIRKGEVRIAQRFFERYSFFKIRINIFTIFSFSEKVLIAGLFMIQCT